MSNETTLLKENQRLLEEIQLLKSKLSKYENENITNIVIYGTR